MAAIEKDNISKTFADAVLGDKPGTVEFEFQQAARDRLMQLRLPGLKDEDWRFVRLRPLTGTEFVPAGEVSADVTADMVEDYALSEADGRRLVFVNGRFSSELSDLSALAGQKGVEVGHFGQDAALPGAASEKLGQIADYYADDYFATLNSAGFSDGAYLVIDKDTAVEGAIQLLYLSSESSTAYAAHPRNFISLARGSKATVVEDYVGPHAGVYFNNVLSEIELADSATLHHTRVQRDGSAAFHIARTAIDLAQGATYNSQNISLGALFSRYDVYGNGDAENIDCTLDGLALLSGKQVSDTHTVMDHRKAHGGSHQLHKMVIDEAAHAVFNGKIFVQPQAQIIDAYQLNRTLLLSPKAKVNAKPQLEIFADDVKCTHGATIGQLDEEQLFYLKSRGLSDAEARDLLVYAFAAEVIELIPVESLKRDLEELVSRRTSRN
jgi:Fe-S cluster assembly protein SufD